MGQPERGRLVASTRTVPTSQVAPSAPTTEGRLSRRRLLVAGASTVAGLLGAIVVVDDELVPGRATLQRLHLDPGCWIDAASCDESGATVEGSFRSRYRHRRVGFTVGYPSGHRPGDRLPLVVMLHGYGADHSTALSGMTPQEAVSMGVDGRRLTPMALVTVDGGGGYWHPHPGDDPMGMVVHELIPMLRRWGLGVPPHRIGAMGISMGGYGAISFAEHYPHLFRAVAAISPAIFATYSWVHSVNPGAYQSAAAFSEYDAITHTAALRGIPVRVASGAEDPFHPWVEELVAMLPPGAAVAFPPGGHTGEFFHSQEPPSLGFLSGHLAVAD